MNGQNYYTCRGLVTGCVDMTAGRPHRWAEFRASLPRTPVGKLSRKELAEEERRAAVLAAQE